MIEYISGKLARLTPTNAVIDIAGIGYDLNISLSTFTPLENKSEAMLLVHEIIREDTHQLYGFATEEERQLFRLLIGVSGVGGNTARTILSTYSPGELQGIIAAENAVLLKNVKGLGLKTAQKIIVELAGKLTGLAEEQAVAATAASEQYDEALAALVMLGFSKSAAEKAVRAVAKEEPSASIEELVRQALKRL